ncbi:hypothetical protein [Nannocystis punicea]|uniref:Uncharacterized protein n=1 Tax=Nannocystis punicea TaxID=2995304 RepID=A0ABY7H800_9BACT|nr:hypothetical protein [Nannocystis poenicansa]WAS95391.1 hypothetical protein O0S08_04460 [Nannocystis poenicansa]
MNRNRAPSAAISGLAWFGAPRRRFEGKSMRATPPERTRSQSPASGDKSADNNGPLDDFWIVKLQ